MSLAGFGGVMVFARRGIVEQHRWMTADEFNETFALCHFLPGPNIVNLSMVSARGSGGSPAASRPLPAWLSPRRDRDHSGDSLCSFRSGRSAAARLAGVSCAAVGLLISVVFRMMMPLVKRRDLAALVVMVAVFVAIGLVRLPLPAVLLVAIPFSLAVTIVVRKRDAA
jgi:chromate transporter